MSHSQGNHHAARGSRRTRIVRRAAERALPQKRRATRARRYTARSKLLRTLLPQALLVAFLAGGTSAFTGHDKEVELSVDGKPTALRTFADSVADLLENEDVRVGRHDIVAPPPHERLADGDRVAVRYGRPVALTLDDGRRQRLWTTERTVEGALRQLRVRAEGARLSASRSRRISREGIELDVHTERSVVILADGRERTVRTNAATVGEALAEAGIRLRNQDTVSEPLDSFPHDGQTVSVQRITIDEQDREEVIPFRTERRQDPNLSQGTEIVEQSGRQGVRRVTYRLRTVDGVERQRWKLRSETVREPRTRIVRVGTRTPPTAATDADHLNWNALAQCESSGRPDAVDPTGTYGGLYQFDTRTWQGLGGKGRPQDASPAEQTRLAKKLYLQRGTSPWPACGHKLHQ